MVGGAQDEQLVAAISQAVRNKKAVLGGHGSAEELREQKNRPMILIGG